MRSVQDSGKLTPKFNLLEPYEELKNKTDVRENRNDRLLENSQIKTDVHNSVANGENEAQQTLNDNDSSLDMMQGFGALGDKRGSGKFHKLNPLLEALKNYRTNIFIGAEERKELATSYVRNLLDM